ncbi:hypothetical protein LPB138_03190 [Urechidicola croceus]|uniref:TonB-dependent receptor plug domain-containing protein n=2 Tax=Urechidicola croceus TaxID=1850246 RepID=A0A1D8P5C1_9FLAO|nr:hypothetical protein LPB138_03190 [Urechidicola croceus]
MSCKSVKEKTTYLEPEFQPDTVVATQPEISLADYLRRLSGVTVKGQGDNTLVLVRTGNSFMNTSEPLFLVDGNTFNGNYSQLSSMINVLDIKSVSVYKEPSETGIYGIRGVNGVINIKLK